MEWGLAGAYMKIVKNARAILWCTRQDIDALLYDGNGNFRKGLNISQRRLVQHISGELLRLSIMKTGEDPVSRIERSA